MKDRVLEKWKKETGGGSCEPYSSVFFATTIVVGWLESI